jgi:hypothetical protein
MSTDARSEDRKKATEGLVLSIIGAVCGALLTNALNGSPTVRLIGTIFGAAIPQLISQVGPGHRLRAGLAISVTAFALFAAYGGFTVFAFASNQKSVVPLPSIVPEPGGTVGNARSAITVNRDSVDCGDRPAVDALLDCGDVTVTSSGNKPLKIWSIDFEPAAPFGQSQDCVKRSPLPKGATCTVHLLFRPLAPPGSRAARMRINGNATGYVNVQGNVTAAESAGDLAVPGMVSCEYVADQGSGPALTLTFEVASAGSGSPSSAVDVTASLDDGSPAPTDRPDFPVGQTDSMSISLPPPPYATPSIPFTIHLDPDQSVQEEDESNNDVHLKFPAPAEGQLSGPVDCVPTG